MLDNGELLLPVEPFKTKRNVRAATEQGTSKLLYEIDYHRVFSFEVNLQPAPSGIEALRSPRAQLTQLAYSIYVYTLYL